MDTASFMNTLIIPGVGGLKVMFSQTLFDAFLKQKILRNGHVQNRFSSFLVLFLFKLYD